ncbi:hypothetical protein [Mycobacteroides abscessus]|uniref:hypothetical protein n=1 Tax=Mycobacteroides abscessus TaxID=36809 RepID=UPI000C269844|nr:hypothetical protein [Mycobacteroides abscessus]
MARVEWSELSGDEAETVLANLLYSKYPTATRVRPSQGDFGIDVIVPAPGGAVDVYQIKKFAGTLEYSEKRQIKDSFRRLMVGMVRRGLPINNWYLVMPVDPTVGNHFDWFTSMPDEVIEELAQAVDPTTKGPLLTEQEIDTIRAWRDAPGRIIKWEGRPFCETLAGAYPHVIDYYLRDGKDRLRAAVADLANILQSDATLPDANSDSTVAVLTPAESRAHLLRLQAVLDTDPHFRYGVSIDPTPPTLTEEPNLVAATQEIQSDGQTLTFRIYVRFQEALNERPIPINLQFAFEDASFDRAAFDDWRKYGKSLAVPVRVDADLPGGLGQQASDKISHLIIEPIGNQHDLRLRIRTPDGSTGPELHFTMTATTGPSMTGLWVQGTDETGFVTFESTFDEDTQAVTIGFRHSGFVDANAAQVLPSLQFIADLHPPNTLQAAEKYGPFHDFHGIPEGATIADSVVDYVRNLTVVQTRTATPVQVPDLSTVTTDDVHSAAAAAALIEGKTLIGSWDSMEFAQQATTPIDTTRHYEIVIIEPLRVTVGAQELTLGALTRKLLSARLVEEGNTLRAVPHQGSTFQVAFAPDRPVPGPQQQPVKGRDLGPLDPRA